jgi:hypothetical protein
MSSTPAITPGATCNVGKGKTRWEVIATEANGTILHLSKVGGDGYTNKWARPDEVNNVLDSTLSVTLGQVLSAREKASKAATLLSDQIRRHAKPEKLTELLATSVQYTETYTSLYRQHLAESGTQPDQIQD